MKSRRAQAKKRLALCGNETRYSKCADKKHSARMHRAILFKLSFLQHSGLCRNVCLLPVPEAMAATCNSANVALASVGNGDPASVGNVAPASAGNVAPASAGNVDPASAGNVTLASAGTLASDALPSSQVSPSGASIDEDLQVSFQREQEDDGDASDSEEPSGSDEESSDEDSYLDPPVDNATPRRPRKHTLASAAGRKEKRQYRRQKSALADGRRKRRHTPRTEPRPTACEDPNDPILALLQAVASGKLGAVQADYLICQ